MQAEPINFFPITVRVIIDGRILAASLEGYRQVPGQFYPTHTLAIVTVAGQLSQLVCLTQLLDESDAA